MATFAKCCWNRARIMKGSLRGCQWGEDKERNCKTGEQNVFKLIQIGVEESIEIPGIIGRKN